MLEQWLNDKQGQVFHYKMEKIQYALKKLGNPEKGLPIIHVAGTNGKGSTIAFMNQLFQAQGLRVGTFVSPHMVSVHDRICINNQPIAHSLYQDLLEKVYRLEQEVALCYEPFRYFEVMVLVMFLYFSQQELDVLLLEVGIGGLLDTTNVVTPQVSVITSIGWDHQDLLGSSLEEIAEQKAGIIKPHRPLVLGLLSEEARTICQRQAASQGAPVYRFGQEFSFQDGYFSYQKGELGSLQLGLRGAHQEENAAVALQAFLLFMEQEEREIQEEKIGQALQETQWAGRLELLCQQPLIYLDGAHNIPAVERLIDFIQEQGKEEVSILFAALKRKDFQDMLALLTTRLPQARLYLTHFSYDGAVRQEDWAAADYVADYQAFLADWQEVGQGSLYITGSLYFVSEVRHFLLQTKR